MMGSKNITLMDKIKKPFLAIGRFITRLAGRSRLIAAMLGGFLKGFGKFGKAIPLLDK